MFQKLLMHSFLCSIATAIFVYALRALQRQSQTSKVMLGFHMAIATIFGIFRQAPPKQNKQIGSCLRTDKKPVE